MGAEKAEKPAKTPAKTPGRKPSKTPNKAAPTEMKEIDTPADNGQKPTKTPKKTNTKTPKPARESEKEVLVVNPAQEIEMVESKTTENETGTPKKSPKKKQTEKSRSEIKGSAPNPKGGKETERKRKYFAIKASLASVDAKHVVHVDKTELRIVNTITGEVAGVLRGHTSVISSVCVSPWNSLQIISCSMDGTVKVWDFTEFTCVQTFENTGFERICGKFAAVAIDKDGNSERQWPCSNWKVVKFSLPIGGDKLVIDKTVITRSNSACFNLIGGSGSNNGSVIVIAGRELILYRDSTGSTDFFRHSSQIMTASLHPQEDVLIFGDKIGHIFVLHFANSNLRSCVKTMWHWHAHAVQSLAFSEDGTHFISGGQEGVLVQWQLVTGSKDFLPRLGGPIREVAYNADGMKWMLVLWNGNLRIIDARLRTSVATIQASSSHASSGKNFRHTLGVVADPSSNAVVVQKTPGQLQFFDIKTNQQLSLVDVTMRNTVSQPEKDKPVFPAFVEKVAFSNSVGNLLVTVEKHGSRRSMKFWSLERGTEATAGQGTYKLTTHVDDPHRGSVVALFVHPSNRFVISASVDGTFRVWSANETTGVWNCRSVGFFRNSSIKAAALSFDGSLLALAYDNVISLWDPIQNSMLTTLMLSGKSCHEISDLAFFKQNLLASASVDGTLSVWDIVKGSVEWSLSCGSVSAIAGTTSKLMVVVKDKKMFVFSKSAVPLEAHEISEDGCRVTGVDYLPLRDTYVFSTDHGTTHLFKKLEETQSERFSTSQSTSLTNYSLLQAATQNSTKRKVEDILGTKSDEQFSDEVRAQAKLTQASSSTIQTLSAYPSYVLPPLSKLMKSLLVTDDSPSRSSVDVEGEEGDETTEQKSKRQKRSESAKHIPTTEVDTEEVRLQNKALECAMTDFFRKNMAKLVH